MKRLAFIALMLVIPGSVSAQVRRTEITTANVASMKGLTSDQLSVLGFYRKMTRKDAEDLLAKSKTVLGERDPVNQERIYVYEEKVDHTKGKSLLYLIWDGKPAMTQLTIFEDAGARLSANFKTLMSSEGIEPRSAFVGRFIGLPDRKEVTLDIPSIELRNTTYYFDRAGVTLTQKTHHAETTYVIAFVKPKP